MSDAQAPELKPCPFCGGGLIGEIVPAMHCRTCNALGPVAGSGADAIARWNTRADVAHPPIASGITDGELEIELRRIVASLWRTTEKLSRQQNTTGADARAAIDTTVKSILAAVNKSLPTPAPRVLTENEIARMWQNFLDKDDRNSPEEYPEMILINFEEFHELALAKGGRS